ncbi:zinc finger BED domain-containing protein 1-like [Ctenocephalides felis]|uniref:zinc finger BED domain-containing protein 1-like n=1 Tax=Ctenocephalides felis TaxID=7515 RepID=UPI000E6E26B6|nr:zinc finger BED domain-containing protein 1-like [Ctenocephalides felis]
MSTDMWKYFEKKSKNEAKCTLCLEVLKTCGNTTNLSKHLKSRHPNVLQIASSSSSTSTSVTAFCRNEIPAKRQKRSEETLNPIMRAFEARASIQPGGDRHNMITNAVLYYICVDHKPINAVKRRDFINLLKTIESSYHLPSDTHFKNLLSTKYNSMKYLLKSELQLKDFYSLTCDIWADALNMVSYLGITIHYLSGEKLKSANLETISLPERHTGDYIKEKLTSVIGDWELNVSKITAIVTDNGSNMVCGIRNFFIAYNSSDKHQSCFAHAINLIVDKAISDVMATDKLREAQIESAGEPLKLILDVKTRWNSCYYMLERFVKLAPYVAQVTISDSNAPDILSAADIKIIRELSNILQPLEYITRELSGEQYVTIPKVIPLVNCLLAQLRSIKPKTPLCIKLKQILIDTANRRFSNVEDNSDIAVATLLDPRFKNLYFRNENACATAIETLRSEICLHTSISSAVLETAPNSFDFWHLHKQIVSERKKRNNTQDEVDLYLKQHVTPLTSNPLTSWEDMKESFPNLYLKFREYATIMATSVPAERLFSEAGTEIIEKRNRQEPDYLNKLLFLAGRSEEDWFN